MTEHTKGPWKVNRTITPGNQTSMFHITGSQHGGLNPICYGADNGDGEFDANARLIAAAPELLEAAKNMSRILEAVRLSAGLRGTQWDRVIKARGAIAKAEGKE